MMNRSNEIEQCIHDCIECQRVCQESVTHCLEMGGKHASQEHIRLLLDCSEICHISTNFMLRGSEFSSKICELCAEICDKCAENCDQFKDDKMMIKCADICRRDAESCRKMAEM